MTVNDSHKHSKSLLNVQDKSHIMVNMSVLCTPHQIKCYYLILFVILTPTNWDSSHFWYLKSCTCITLGEEEKARTVVGSIRVGLTDRLMTHHMEMLGEFYPEGDNNVFLLCVCLIPVSLSHKNEKEETARLWKLTATCTKTHENIQTHFAKKWHTVFRHRRGTDKRTGTVVEDVLYIQEGRSLMLCLHFRKWTDRLNMQSSGFCLQSTFRFLIRCAKWSRRGGDFFH